MCCREKCDFRACCEDLGCHKKTPTHERLSVMGRASTTRNWWPTGDWVAKLTDCAARCNSVTFEVMRIVRFRVAEGEGL